MLELLLSNLIYIGLAMALLAVFGYQTLYCLCIIISNYLVNLLIPKGLKVAILKLLINDYWELDY